MDGFEFKTIRTQRHRIDSVDARVYRMVPPEVFEDTKDRIRMEMAILKANGVSPATVNCEVADEILQNVEV